MDDSLTQIAAYTNVWEAELACNRLAEEQIPATLGNVVIVSWFWYYSNAVGGVTVHVPRRDAQAAWRLLMEKPVHESQRRRTCPGCGATACRSWVVCWQCGGSIDGNSNRSDVDHEPEPQPIPESAVGAGMLPVGFALVAMVVLLSGGPRLLLFLMPLIVLFFALLRVLDGMTSARAMSEATKSEPDDDLPRRKESRVAKAIITRAWRAAAFGALMFPPLGLYAIWLLLRLPGRDFRLSPADQLRCQVAVVFGLVAVLIGLLFLWALLFALSFDLFRFLSEYSRFADAWR